MQGPGSLISQLNASEVVFGCLIERDHSTPFFQVRNRAKEPAPRRPPARHDAGRQAASMGAESDDICDDNQTGRRRVQDQGAAAEGKEAAAT